MSADAAWLDARTAGAPARLRARALDMVAAVPAGGGRVPRLATAGGRALEAATAAGSDRGAALDLLAADALITLALLAAAEDAPDVLGGTARALRLGTAR